MTKKQWIIRIILAVLVVAALAAAGYELYNLGYSRGVAATTTRLANGRAAANNGGNTETDRTQPGRKGSPLEGKPGKSPNSGNGGVFIPRGQTDKYNNNPPGNNQGRSGQGMQNYSFQHPMLQAQPTRFNTYPARNPVFPIVAGIVLVVIALVGLWLVYKFITLLMAGQGWQLSFSRIEETKAKK